MKNIPTPETNACTQVFLRGDKNPYPELCENLERRLTVAREALKFAFDAVTSVTVRSRGEGEILQGAARVVKETLTATAPK